MTIQIDTLIQELKDMTIQHLEYAEYLLHNDLDTLNKRSSPESWSTLECFEHLNLYGYFYLPEIEKRIQSAKTIPSSIFKSGILGNYFAKMMLLKEKLNKMKTFSSMNPINTSLDKNVLYTFIAQQKKTLELLERARNVNWNQVKTSISISKFIKLKLGDTFRVVIYHNYRHIVQAKKVLGEE